MYSPVTLQCHSAMPRWTAIGTWRMSTNSFNRKWDKINCVLGQTTSCRCEQSSLSSVWRTVLCRPSLVWTEAWDQHRASHRQPWHQQTSTFGVWEVWEVAYVAIVRYRSWQAKKLDRMYYFCGKSGAEYCCLTSYRALHESLTFPYYRGAWRLFLELVSPYGVQMLAERTVILKTKIFLHRV